MSVFIGHRSDESWFMGKSEGPTALLLTSPWPHHWEGQVWWVAMVAHILLAAANQTSSQQPLCKGGFGELKAAFVIWNTERGKWVRSGNKTKTDKVTAEAQVSQHGGMDGSTEELGLHPEQLRSFRPLNGFSASWHSCSTPCPSMTPYRHQSSLLVAYHGAWVGSSTTG